MKLLSKNPFEIWCVFLPRLVAQGNDLTTCCIILYQVASIIGLHYPATMKEGNK
jgi:hypothetical protein